MRSLQETAFLHRNGQDGGNLCKACDLLDPANPVLSRVFYNRPEMFPADEFCHSDWLPVLRGTGLRSEVCTRALPRLSHVPKTHPTLPTDARACD